MTNTSKSRHSTTSKEARASGVETYSNAVGDMARRVASHSSNSGDLQRLARMVYADAFNLKSSLTAAVVAARHKK